MSLVCQVDRFWTFREHLAAEKESIFFIQFHNLAVEFASIVPGRSRCRSMKSWLGSTIEWTGGSSESGVV